MGGRRRAGAGVPPACGLPSPVARRMRLPPTDSSGADGPALAPPWPSAWPWDALWAPPPLIEKKWEPASEPSGYGRGGSGDGLKRLLVTALSALTVNWGSGSSSSGREPRRSGILPSMLPPPESTLALREKPGRSRLRTIEIMPTGASRNAAAAILADVTCRPLIVDRTSPTRKPAVAAGPSNTTFFTVAPSTGTDRRLSRSLANATPSFAPGPLAIFRLTDRDSRSASVGAIGVYTCRARGPDL
mmetsp:Transcript_23969/g.77343  ORF Transcript_23969/g.77343 Transcript_23969/m.77343 type:complete len:245 (-) Transcript_23969:70-804(-)